MNFFSNRAFAAFTVALAASMWALFTDIGRPYLPSVPIVVYTLYLYANRTSVGQLGGDALKDSPYFLGFLLTMFALFKIFNDVSFSSSLFGQNPALMTQEVGGAVLTTIVGLFCRQALLALVQDEAPEEDDRLAALATAVTSHAVAFEVARQQFFREMADERARQTEEFTANQARFLADLNAVGDGRAPQTAPSAFAASEPATVVTAPPVASSAGGAPTTSVTKVVPLVPVVPVVAVVPTARPVAGTQSMAEEAVTAVVEASPPRGAEGPRTQPYAGPTASTSTPTSSPTTTPPGSAPAVGSATSGSTGPATDGPNPGSSGVTPPYSPYFGQGRASNTTRPEE